MFIEKLKKRIAKSLKWSEEDLNKLIYEDQDCLHDPFLYTNMEELIDKLYQFELAQKQDRTKLVIVDPDYDTDGNMCAAVITASLSEFGINHRVYIPSMKDGYGLSPKAVDDMLQTFSDVSLILTADNGTNAVAGVTYANELGIPTLVTDHHLGSGAHAPAEVIVNPNVAGDTYPFKGNAGAAVAWKTMLAYAMKYHPESIKRIEELIVFAGIANVADVMPITDENHYMVRRAVEVLKDYRLKSENGGATYEQISATGNPGYDVVFHGLYDCIHMMQTERDKTRKEQGKKPSPLPKDEELISWYLSPLINAPRRVSGTPVSAFKGLLHPSPIVRHDNILQMIKENTLKSQMRDEVLYAITPELYGQNSNVLVVNTEHGIAGLIAGNIANETKRPTIVFAIKTESPQIIYTDTTMLDYISGSARSTDLAPLDMIVTRLRNEVSYEITGGGHACAAGYQIHIDNLEDFKKRFDRIASEVASEKLQEYEDAIAAGLIQKSPQNVIHFAFYQGMDNDEHLWYNITENKLNQDLRSILTLWSQLKPFGNGFGAKTEFTMDLDPTILPKYDLNLDFWKTFKATIDGCELLTFDIGLASKVKAQIESKDATIIPVKVELKENIWMGKSTPQLVLSRA